MMPMTAAEVQLIITIIAVVGCCIVLLWWWMYLLVVESLVMEDIVMYSLQLKIIGLLYCLKHFLCIRSAVCKWGAYFIDLLTLVLWHLVMFLQLVCSVSVISQAIAKTRTLTVWPVTASVSRAIMLWRCSVVSEIAFLS